MVKVPTELLYGGAALYALLLLIYALLIDKVLERLASFIQAVVGKRLAYERLIT